MPSFDHAGLCSDATESEIREAVRPWLADYKIPERILFVKEMPKGLSGKVDRRALKEMLQAEAAASAAYEAFAAIDDPRYLSDALGRCLAT